MQASAAGHLHSHTQGEQGSASRSSMWPVLVLGILSAIIAWVWYRGSGEEEKAAETIVQKPDQLVDPTVPPEGAQERQESKPRPEVASGESKPRPEVASGESKPCPVVASGESKLLAADPKRREQKVPCPEIQEKKAVNPEVHQPRCEQQPELQVQEIPGGEHLKSGSDVPSRAAAPLKVQEEPGVADQLSGVPAKGDLQGHIQEQENHVPKEKGLHGNIKEHLPDLKREEETQANKQEHLTGTSEKGEPAEHQIRVPGIQVSLLEERLEDVVHTHVGFLDQNDDLRNHEGDMHPSDIPIVRELLSNGDEVYPPLIKEVTEEEYPQDLSKTMVQAIGEGGCPPLMAEDPGAPQLLNDSCHASKSEQENEQGEECQEGVYANGDVDGAKQGTEHVAGCPLENIKEDAVNVMEAKKTSTRDLHLEMIHGGNAIVADAFVTHESVEECDVGVCSSTEKALEDNALEDHADVSAGISTESSQEGLLDFQKPGTGPETSSVEVFNFMSKQEKNLSGLGSPNTDEKTSYGCPSEENIHDLDPQKARKVATIQPMPQNVDFAFRVHYITHSDSQIIAVTGDHEKLGKWEAYVPLTSGNGGFWTHSITLPADTTLAWKFVMVENGKIKRWEECNNRFLKTTHEDIEAHLYWGYP